MKRPSIKMLRKQGRAALPLLAVAAVIAGLMLYKLGSLTKGLSIHEIVVSQMTLGWHGLTQNPLYFPLTFVRSVFFILFSHHGQTVVRLGNTIFGVLAVLAFSKLVQLWYGGRTALLSSIMFISSAWMLHVSRYASNDVLYLAALPVLFYTQIGIKQAKKPLWLFCGATIWGLALYIPGLVWIVGVQVWLLRKEIKRLWQLMPGLRSRIALGSLAFVWLPLLASYIFRSFAHLFTWLGFPTHFPAFIELIKQFAAVPIHLFIHGPKNPELWLGRTPVLDIFSLTCAALGIYFYAKHFKAARSRALFSIFAVSWVLVALGGPVSLSLLVPLLYVFVACGLGFLLHDWLKVFPRNPFARSFGIGLIILAVTASSFYNLRAYFVAWPHSTDTISVFTHKP